MSVPVPPRPTAECMHPSANHPGAAMARHAARPTIACVAAANLQRKGWLSSLRASPSQVLRLSGRLGADFPLCPSCLTRHPRLELRATTHGRPGVLAPWRGGRVVDCTALEMRHGCKPIGGSNPPLSARLPTEANSAATSGASRTAQFWWWRTFAENPGWRTSPRAKVPSLDGPEQYRILAKPPLIH